MAPLRLGALDAFPKTLDDLKERTLGGAAISIAAIVLMAILFVSEYRHFRTIETVDKLGVDVSTRGKIAVNLDMYLPSLPCAEFVVDLVDESGLQQLHATDALHKLRMDRHGVPVDVPTPVDWGHTVATAFRHRKVMSLLDTVEASLRQTMEDIDEDKRATGHDEHTVSEHEAHRRMLTHRAKRLQESLSKLSAMADPGEGENVLEALHMSQSELTNIRDDIHRHQLYSDTQATAVNDNLNAMEQNLERLRSDKDSSVAANLHEALRIRLEILQDNLKGFVSPEDLQRKDKYKDLSSLLEHLHNSSKLPGLSDEDRQNIYDTATHLQDTLDELASGASGAARAEAEVRLARGVAVLQAELAGMHDPGEGYCGSCYGAQRDPGQCCNTCDDVKAAYRVRRWGMPDERQFEQCRREAKRRDATIAEGEGCTVYGSIFVHRSQGILHLAPVSTATHNAAGAPVHNAGMLSFAEVAHFNVSHRINRLSFGDDFPGQVSPLDGVVRTSMTGPGVARYFIKVVPTVYVDIHGREVASNQFASTEHFKPVREEDRVFQSPGIHFSYDITPLRVLLTEKRGRTLISFLTRCAATIGGVFTVAGIIDKLFYSSQRLLMKKLEIGKAS